MREIIFFQKTTIKKANTIKKENTINITVLIIALNISRTDLRNFYGIGNKKL